MTDSYSRRSGKRSAKLRKRGGNVVTYFCTPRGRVLHFLVGPVRPDTLLESAQWSQEIFQQLTEQEEAGQTLDQRRRWMAIQHEEHLSQESEVLGKVTKWLSGAADSGNLTVGAPVEKTFETILETLRATTGDDGHQLLHERPLPMLKDIEAPVFEVLARESFSRRANQLRERVLNNVQDGQPSLLMVADYNRVRRQPSWDEVDTAQQSEPDPNQFLPKAARVQKHLHAFRCEVLSNGELTMVVAALDHPPIKLPHGTRAKYVIINRQGEIAHVVSDVYPVGVLVRILEKYGSTKQGNTAQSTEPESSRTSSEQLARGELRLATSLLAKRPEKARVRLKTIVAKYPNTETAANAQRFLALNGK